MAKATQETPGRQRIALVVAGAVLVCIAAVGLALAFWPGLFGSGERLQNTGEVQEAVFLIASHDYYDHFGERPVIDPQTRDFKTFDGNQVWLDNEARALVVSGCRGAKAASDLYRVEASVQLRSATTMLPLPGNRSVKAPYWSLSIRRMQRCQPAE